MIKYFSVQNFRSIREECILEFDENFSGNSNFTSNPVVGFASHHICTLVYEAFIP